MDFVPDFLAGNLLGNNVLLRAVVERRQLQQRLLHDAFIFCVAWMARQQPDVELRLSVSKRPGRTAREKYLR